MIKSRSKISKNIYFFIILFLNSIYSLYGQAVAVTNPQYTLEKVREGWKPFYVNENTGEGDIKFYKDGLELISVGPELENMDGGYKYKAFFQKNSPKIVTIGAAVNGANLVFVGTQRSQDTLDIKMTDTSRVYDLSNPANNMNYKLTVTMEMISMKDPSFNSRRLTFLPGNLDHQVLKMDFEIKRDDAVTTPLPPVRPTHIPAAVDTTAPMQRPQTYKERMEQSGKY